jgi:hypothetical protein
MQHRFDIGPYVHVYLILEDGVNLYREELSVTPPNEIGTLLIEQISKTLGSDKIPLPELPFWLWKEIKVTWGEVAYQNLATYLGDPNYV